MYQVNSFHIQFSVSLATKAREKEGKQHGKRGNYTFQLSRINAVDSADGGGGGHERYIAARIIRRTQYTLQCVLYEDTSNTK